MKDALMRYGLKLIFENEEVSEQAANFRQTPMEEIYQTLHFVVNEQGTMLEIPQPEEKRFEKEEQEVPRKTELLFKVNKPFVFLIYDQPQGVILYIIIINDPTDIIPEEMDE